MKKERLTENLKTQWRKAYGFPDHTEEVSPYAEFLEGVVIKQLDLIQSLYDLQNGPPLVKYEKEWGEVMERINKHLEKIIQLIYEAGYQNGSTGRDKDNFNVSKAVREIEAALIWYDPDMVPKGNQYVLNQSRERVTWDSYDKEWYSYDIPTRLAHVERWRYDDPEPIKL